MWVQSLGQEDLCRRKWQPPPVFLSGKSHGQRSLASKAHGVTQKSDTMTCKLYTLIFNLSHHISNLSILVSVRLHSMLPCPMKQAT